MNENIDIDFDLDLDWRKKRKEEMYRDVQFPFLAPKEMWFNPYKYREPPPPAKVNPDGSITLDPGSIMFAGESVEPDVGAYILCVVDVVQPDGSKKTFPGIYKWRRNNNPKDITAWTYIDLALSTGPVRYVEYKDEQHEDVIYICESKSAQSDTDEDYWNDPRC